MKTLVIYNVMINSRVVNTSRIILAILFIFSGVTKWIDPAGSQIKFTEYFHAFGADALVPLAWPMAVAVPAMELFIGLMLALGIYRRFFAWASLIFMSFFTLLTFVIWQFVPVSDCGCFGDFLKLGNGETFAKNLVFMVPALLFFLGRGIKGRTTGNESTVVLLLAAWSLLMPLYAATHLPLLDFLPYGEGADIKTAMAIPDGADAGEHRTRLLYRDRQTGEKKLFEINDTTWWDDTRWEYMSTEHEVIREGYTPAITSFSAVDAYGTERGGELLSHDGYIALVTVRSLDEAADPSFGENLDILRGYAGCGVETVIATQLDLKAVSDVVGGGILCLNMDETQLKSMVRSKSGVMFLNDGVVVAKRNMLRELPQICGRSPEEVVSSERRRIVSAMAIYAFVGLAIAGGYLVMRKNGSKFVTSVKSDNFTTEL